MQAAGIVSHGGFDFGRRDTEGTDRLLEGTPLRWIETRHFEIGMGLETYRIRAEERAKIRRELTELHEVLPDVSPRVRSLDPWLRLHLYAKRVDELWSRVLAILRVSDEDFPAPGQVWHLGEPYHGEGPHLGQVGKFELLLLPNKKAQTLWLDRELGLRAERTQRWNIGDRKTLTVAINADEPRLRRDGALHGHVVFSLTINLVDGYEFYAYDTPVWLREGLAHYLERELDPSFNSFSYAEASLAEETRRSDWSTAVRRLIQKDEAPTIAELVHLQTPAQLTLPHHYVAWSMTAFLVEEHGTGYACLMEGLHGIRDAKGRADGSGIIDKHRELFHSCLGMRYHQFDTAWRAWASKQSAKKRAEGKRFRARASGEESRTPMRR